MAYTAWIKLEHTTPDKNEVYRLAEILNIDPDAAFGKVVRFWIWADQNSENGNLNVTTSGVIDRHVHCPGFCDAMIKVGWLCRTDDGLAVSNFDRHNSESAKKRAKNVKKTQKYRASCDQNVTDLKPEEGNVLVTPSYSLSSSSSLSSGDDEGSGEEEAITPPPALNVPAFRAEWASWESYLLRKFKRKLNNEERQEAWKRLLEKALVGAEVAFAVSTIKQSISEGWKGLWPKEPSLAKLVHVPARKHEDLSIKRAEAEKIGQSMLAEGAEITTVMNELSGKYGSDIAHAAANSAGWKLPEKPKFKKPA